MNINSVTTAPLVETQLKAEKTTSSSEFQAMLEAAKASGNTEELREATDELEAIFLNMMMKTMRESIPDSEGIFKKSEAEETFQTMLDEEYTKNMSEAGGIGISDMIFDQFQKYLYNDEEKQATSFEMKG